MKAALAALGSLALAGCARAAEGVVRDQAAAAFSCADYALQVEEVGPDVYRASGCGRELIYACRPVTSGQAALPADPDEVADSGSEAVICTRQVGGHPQAPTFGGSRAP
jgi:hypothetical protein